MSGPNAESGHAPQPADNTSRVLAEAKRRLDRRGLPAGIARDIILEVVRGLLDAGVIVAGPAVTGRIEEA